MSSFFQENLTIIQQRWPQLAAALAAAAPEPRAELVQDGRQATLLIDGIHLTSSYDRQAEARLQANLIPEGSAEAWVYGLALGDLPRSLLGRSDLLRLRVVLINLTVARQSFEFFDHRDWLADVRVEILTAADRQQVNFPFAAVPSCLQLADNASARLRDLVFLELATPFIRKRHRIDKPEIRSRLAENEPFLAEDGNVAELFGKYQGRTVIVAAAGPTLGDHFDRLLHRTNPLVAVDAALKPLTRAGIVPDVVLTTDGHPTLIPRFFRESDLSGCNSIPLVYFPTVHQNALELWPGPRYTAYSSGPLFQELRHRYPKGELFSSGSVLHPATDLAVKMGAAQVVLLGADFAYPDGKSHVDGCIASQRVGDSKSHWVLDWQGNRLATDPHYRGYLRDLESYIALCPQVRFFGGSSRGARIHGAGLWEAADAL